MCTTTTPQQPQRTGWARTALSLALLVGVLLIALFGRPVASVAAAVICVTLAPVLLPGKADYAPLTRALARAAAALKPGA